MVLWDTGCSNELIHPDFAQQLIGKGASWRYCDPLHMQHGNAAATRAAAPSTKQVCAEVFLSHKGHKFFQKEVWFYVYDGALPDVMLSDGFLNAIPCTTEPGRKLLDTTSEPQDEVAVLSYTKERQTEYDSVAEFKATSRKPPQQSAASVHSVAEQRGEEPASAEPAPTAATEQLSSERIQAMLAEMAAQRERLRARLGKPVSNEALVACMSVLDRYPGIFRPPGSDPCKLGIFKITLKDRSKFHVALPRRVNPLMLQEIRRQVEELVLQGAIERVTTRPSSVYAIVMARRPNAPGKHRLCVDLVALNDNTVPMPYAIPEVHQALDRLAGRKLYCTFDFSSWFHQFEIAEEDRDKVAFIVPGDSLSPPQIYRYKRVAFGLMNATYFCQRQLQEALEKWPGCEGIFPFVDDIVIAADNVEEMCQKLESFCQFCQHYNIRLKKEKCELAASAVKHVGFILSEEGKSLDPSRVDTLLRILPPHDLKALKSLLGSFGFIRGWLANCASIAAPLTDLMGSTARKLGFSWGPEQDAALAALKVAVQLAPATHAPDYTKPFHLFVDASDVGVAAVLMQWKVNPETGETIPAAILHASRRWSVRESRWQISERELYGIKYGMEKFREYLQGVPDLTIHTDHLNLVTGMWQHSSPKIERWRMFLESCRPFKLRHIKGTSELQRPADCLSRLHARNLAWEPITPDSEDEEAQLAGEGGNDEQMFGTCNAAQFYAHFRGRELKEAVNTCIPADCHTRMANFKDYGKGQDLLLRATKKRAIDVAAGWHPRYQPRAHELLAQTVLPAGKDRPGIGLNKPHAQTHCALASDVIACCEHVSDWEDECEREEDCGNGSEGLAAAIQSTQTTPEDHRAAEARARGIFRHAEILKRAHDHTHPSFAATWRRVIRAVGHQPATTMTELRKEVREHLKTCLICQKIQPARERLAARIGSIRQRPFTRYAFDIIVMSEPDLDGNRYILVCVDSFSRAVELFALPRGDAETVAAALHDVLARWGRPLEVCCDNAKAFTSSVVKSLLKMARVDQHLVAPYNHNGNGQVENCNRRVMEIMRALVLEDYLGPNSRVRWSLLLPQVRRTLMTRTINQHGCTPNDLAYMHAPETEDSIFAEEAWLPPMGNEAQEPVPEWITDLKTKHEAILLKCEEMQEELLAKLAAESERELQEDGARPLQVGDFVLLKMEERPHVKDQAPWAGPYEVLELPDHDPHAPTVLAQHIATKAVGKFNVSMLKRCYLSHLQSLEEAIAVAAKDSFEYVIEAVLAHRPEGPRKQRGSRVKAKSSYEFQVLWKDYPQGEDNPSWEPWENVSLRQSEPFKTYCARPDVAAMLGDDFAAEE